MQKKSIFWFRQDLRTFDNKWLIASIKNSTNLFPIFILDKNIIPSFLGFKNKKFLFLKQALLNLDNDLKKLWWKLTIYNDFPENIIPVVCEKYNIDSIYTNKTYSTYWKSRDAKIETFCLQNNIDFFEDNDYLLVEPEEIEVRKVFTPYYKLWQKKLLEKDISSETPKAFKQIENDFDINSFLDSLIVWEKHPYFDIDFLNSRIWNFNFSGYDDFRNLLDKDWTSKLSVFLRFWVISIRYLYNHIWDKSESYKSELAWREFWQHINYNFPYTKKIEFQLNKRHIQWRHDKALFEKWCMWETGYPVVDACMKQLVETNWMHGRGRMIVASFLTKDLLIDWRWGEDFFKKNLLDYDENVNFWNWQWSASVWADPKPLRIFNPCLQSAKFDKNAIFIKKYLPSLKLEEIKSIHNPMENEISYIDLIVDHREAQRLARQVYKNNL